MTRTRSTGDATQDDLRSGPAHDTKTVVADAARLRALDAYHVLDTEPEPGFDQIVRLTCQSLRVPIALVSLVAADRQFFKARRGLEICGTPLAGSFCQYAIQAGDIMVVPDAELDPRFAQSPFVVGEPGVRFYAGAPLITPDGRVIGSLCAIDRVPRDGLSDEERRTLLDLSELVMERLEARRLAIAENGGRHRFEAVAGASIDAIICADSGNRILSWNAAAERMFGYGADEVVGQSLSLIVPPDMRPMHEAGLARAAAGHPTKLVGSLVTIQALRRDGTQFPIELSLSRWSEGGEHRFGAIARDITDRIEAERRLKRAAEHDALTDLANRSALVRRMDEAAAAGREASLVLIDLDGFKEVNDSLGHAAGDDTLVEVARRLTDLAGETSLVSRLGGDEFVVLSVGDADASCAVDVARSAIAAIERPIEVGERSVYVGASAGIAATQGGDWTVDGLLADADLALYRAKRDGKGLTRLFTPELRPLSEERVSIGSGLRQAWERQEFELYYQPQVRLKDGAIVGAEALIRWNHPERGVVAPGAFLSILEGSLLAVPVSEWILRTACAQAEIWLRGRDAPFRMGVNLSAAQFRAGDLPDVVERALGDCGLPPDALELEITENIVLQHQTRITADLCILRDRGVGISFDDYGTGYASLTMLKDVPVTRLKIDRSFVSGAAFHDGDRAIVEAIVRLARGFDLDVIAEGIETVQQASFMRAYCGEAQGYLFGRPMQAAAFEALLQRDAPSPAWLPSSDQAAA
ncbi:EAL domain-containing protein [Aureimonas sp. Leaf454]|uniref:putative bifunctional diguanylate cyclase/phosphodiesterase n=1 Tax=Aureimonas sp. Leaf454 TaxID=1736381 RepID=UPI0009EC0872|nr:EAL domain-containing protein [Aureimonas sp. Leaf454]